MPKNEVVVRSHAPQLSPSEQFDFDWRMGKALAASQMFKDARQAEQAFAKIVVGRELGLSPAQSMTGLHLVEGNVQAHYATLGLFVRSNGYDYRIVEHTNERCAVEFGPAPAPGKDENGEWLPWPQAVGTSAFSIDDAATAGLIRGAKMFEKFPRNMLFARAMSNGVKWFCPEVLGGVPVYFEGEIEPTRVIDGQPASEAQGGAEISLSAVAEDIPADLRDRFYAAYGEAADLRPGQVTPAAVGMTVRGQSEERIREFIESIEAANEAARAAAPKVEEEEEEEEGVEDAEVVPDGPVEEPAVESLRRQLADLEALQVEIEESPGDFAETSAELDRISVEMDRIEAEIEAAESDEQGRLL